MRGAGGLPGWRLGWWVSCVTALVLAACAADLDRAPVVRVEGGDAAHGQELLSTYGCTSCHTIPGIRGADATVGPPLTDWGERWYIAGLLVNEPDNLIHWIQAPQSVKPGVAMPDLGVTTGQARDMAAYLYTLVDGGYDASPAEPAPDEITPGASPADSTPTDDAGEEVPGERDLISMGESVYSQHCAGCHGNEGAGADGAYPALAGSDFVTGEPEAVIELVVNGRGGMPAFGDDLSNEALAAVISYVRNAWGNQGSILSPDDVAAER